MEKLRKGFTGFLILVAGNVGIIVINIIGTYILQSIFGSAINAEGLPLTDASTAGFLIMLFIAGMTGAFIIVLLTRSHPWLLIGIFLVFALIIDLLAILGPLDILPLWAKIIVMVSIPPQLWAGAKIGLILKGRKKNDS